MFDRRNQNIAPASTVVGAMHNAGLAAVLARIRAADYLSHPEMFSPDFFSVDTVICPEQMLTDYIAKLIEFPESLQVLEFADGKVSLVAVRAFHGGPLVGKELQYLRAHMPQIDTRVAAIFRQDSPIIPEGNTVIEAGSVADQKVPTSPSTARSPPSAEADPSV